MEASAGECPSRLALRHCHHNDSTVNGKLVVSIVWESDIKGEKCPKRKELFRTPMLFPFHPDLLDEDDPLNPKNPVGLPSCTSVCIDTDPSERLTCK